MGTQQNTIVILAIVASIIVVLFIAFRNFDLGKALGIPDIQKGFDDASKSINDWFAKTGKDFDNFFKGFDEKQLAGKTIDTSDKFGTGAQETFSEDTIIDKDGRISGKKDSRLSDADRKLIADIQTNEKKVQAETQSILSKENLTKDDIASINKIANDFHKLNSVGFTDAQGMLHDSTPRDKTGVILPQFRASAIQQRATKVYIASKSQTKRKFGGFNSFEQQEQAFRKAIQRSDSAEKKFDKLAVIAKRSNK